MTASREQAQALVLALNNDEVPFVYEATPYGVRGLWKYADVKWAALTAAGTSSASTFSGRENRKSFSIGLGSASETTDRHGTETGRFFGKLFGGWVQ